MTPYLADPDVTLHVGDKAINDRLWQFECGCIEGVHPYHWYPCSEHRKRRALWGWWRRSEMPKEHPW